jgi:hypothetical protein
MDSANEHEQLLQKLQQNGEHLLGLFGADATIGYLKSRLHDDWEEKNSQNTSSKSFDNYSETEYEDWEGISVSLDCDMNTIALVDYSKRESSFRAQAQDVLGENRTAFMVR